MTTRERIEQDLTREQKARNASAVSTLRMLRASLKNMEIEKMKPLEEADVISVISREVKKLKDGLESYTAGGRQDLADQAKVEITLLETYLPQQLTDEELRALIRQKVSELGATGPKEMGKVVGQVMKDAQGRADGGKVSAMVKEELSPAPT